MEITFRDTERKKMEKARRRARKHGLPATASARDWWVALDYFGHRCAVCGCRFETSTVDHWIPIVQGGGTTADNILPLCVTCNGDKGGRDGLAWLLERYGDARGRQLHQHIQVYFEFTRIRSRSIHDRFALSG